MTPGPVCGGPLLVMTPEACSCCRTWTRELSVSVVEEVEGPLLPLPPPREPPPPGLSTGKGKLPLPPVPLPPLAPAG